VATVVNITLPLIRDYVIGIRDYVIALSARLRCRVKQRLLLGLPRNCQVTFKNIHSVKSTFIPSVTVDIFERDRKHLTANAKWTASPRSTFPLHPQASNWQVIRSVQPITPSNASFIPSFVCRCRCGGSGQTFCKECTWSDN